MQKKLNKNQLKFLENKAKEARADIVTMTTVSSSGHPGGSMSSIDMYLTTIYFSNIFKNCEKINNGEVENITFETKKDEKLDGFYVSHGHTSPGLYSALAAFNIVPRDEMLASFRKADSPFAGHVEQMIPFVPWDTGNLGQGISAATAKALYYKKNDIDSHVFVYMGDGEQQKGQISEARRFANMYNLSNMTVFIDYNQLQISGDIHKVMEQDLETEWKSGGFEILRINGHDYEEIYEAMYKAKQDSSKPYCIIADTVMGKGVSFMENKEKFHGSTLGLDDCKKALEEIGVSRDVEKYIELRKNDYSNLKKEFAENQKKAYWVKDINKEINDKSPEYYTEDNKKDCRSAYGDVLVEIADEVKSIPVYVFDCDLAGSVKTGGFKAKYPENFIQTGIQEHHAATCSGALSKEKALVFFSDFAIFGCDETFNQQRLNQINHANLKGIFTHAGTNVGEDGRTHHCISYTSLINTIEGAKLILPADPNQTKDAVRYAAKQDGNYFVIMGRSKLPLVRNNDELYFGENYEFNYGDIDVIFKSSKKYVIAAGPNFGEAYLGVKKARDEGIDVGLINVSCPLDLPTSLKSEIDGKEVGIFEDHNASSGLANLIFAYAGKNGLNCKFENYGITGFAPSGDFKSIYKQFGLDSDSVYEYCKK